MGWAVFALSAFVPAIFAMLFVRFRTRSSAEQVTHAASPLEPPDATQLKLENATQVDPLDINSRWQLCEHIEGVFHRSKRRALLPSVLSCYNELWSAMQALRSTPENHPRRRWLDIIGWQKIAHIVGDKHVTYAESLPERYRVAAARLNNAVEDEAYCRSPEQTALLALDPRKNTASCVRSYAVLLLALKAAGADWNEVDRAFAASQRLPDPLPWAGPKSIHLQRSGFRSIPLWDVDTFPFIRKLEEKAPEIRKEFQDAIGTFGFGATQGTNVELLAEGNAWTNIRLYDHLGRWNETLCASFSTVCSLLQGRPELDRKRFLRSPAGNLSPPPLGVNFYQLLPGKNISPHFGTHSRLVASLGVEVSAGSEATLRVGGAELQWQQDKAVIFDDSFEHEVLHRGRTPRIVLAVVFLHPDAQKP